MSDTSGAVEAYLDTVEDCTPMEATAYVSADALREFARAHDAEDARRDTRLEIAEDQWLECRDGWDAAVAVLRQARKALDDLLGEHVDDYGDGEEWASMNAAVKKANAALAAIDALEVRG